MISVESLNTSISYIPRVKAVFNPWIHASSSVVFFVPKKFRLMAMGVCDSSGAISNAPTPYPF